VHIVLIISVDISEIQPDHELVIINGDNTTLQCQASIGSTNRTVAWYYAKSRNTSQNVVFNSNSIDSKFIDRVSVDVDHSSRDYNLSLHNVQINESGWYICVDDDNFRSYMLNVYG
jgi:hypothetical protein